MELDISTVQVSKQSKKSFQQFQIEILLNMDSITFVRNVHLLLKTEFAFKKKNSTYQPPGEERFPVRFSNFMRRRRKREGSFFQKIWIFKEASWMLLFLLQHIYTTADRLCWMLIFQYKRSTFLSLKPNKLVTVFKRDNFFQLEIFN